MKSKSGDLLAAEGTLTAFADRSIVVVRDRPVILDSELAALFGVTTKVLNQAVKRNADRFPGDFAMRLTPLELANLKSQIVTSSSGSSAHGGRRRSTPLAFTEHGAVMAASVLNSPRAVEISIYVVRAFVRMREFWSRDAQIQKHLEELAGRVDGHDARITEILQYLSALAQPAASPKRRKIGFRVDPDAEPDRIGEGAPPKYGKPAKRAKPGEGAGR